MSDPFILAMSRSRAALAKQVASCTSLQQKLTLLQVIRDTIYEIEQNLIGGERSHLSSPLGESPRRSNDVGIEAAM